MASYLLVFSARLEKMMFGFRLTYAAISTSDLMRRCQSYSRVPREGKASFKSHTSLALFSSIQHFTRTRYQHNEINSVASLFFISYALHSDKPYPPEHLLPPCPLTHQEHPSIYLARDLLILALPILFHLLKILYHF